MPNAFGSRVVALIASAVMGIFFGLDPVEGLRHE